MRRSFLSELLFPPKCVGCKERLDIFDGKRRDEDAFCPKCRAEWEREKLESCPSCGVAAIDCACCPSTLKRKYIDCIALIKFGRTLSADRLIYTIKKRRIQKAFSFASDELAKRFKGYCHRYNLDLSEAIFTNVPRKASSVARYGFDHAKLLSEMTAKLTGNEYAELLVRRGRSRDQKKLSGEERRRNVEGKFAVAPNTDLKGKTVVLVDDVVTTGNTAYQCIRALRKQGVSKVVLLSIARAPQKKRPRRRKRRIKSEKDERPD